MLLLLVFFPYLVVAVIILLLHPQVESFSVVFPKFNAILKRNTHNIEKKMKINSNFAKNNENDGENDLQLKKDALELLDCMTSPKDPDDPAYDVEKDLKRDEVLFSNDHSALKIELRRRGLRQNGDKLEMIARLLLHVIDPTINYNSM